MKKVLFIASVAALSLASCAPMESVTTTLEYMESSARVLEADHNMLLTPIIADLEVSQNKITYTEKEMFANLDVTRSLLNNIVELKKIAISRAARANNADVLVGSTIDIVTKNDRIEITVSGYPAHYVKFRKAVEDDVKLLKSVYNVKTVDGTNILASPSSTLNVERVEKVER